MIYPIDMTMAGHPEKEMKISKSRWAFAADSIAWVKLV
jgi:hypothetical protein